MPVEDSEITDVWKSYEPESGFCMLPIQSLTGRRFHLDANAVLPLAAVRLRSLPLTAGHCFDSPDDAAQIATFRFSPCANL